MMHLRLRTAWAWSLRFGKNVQIASTLRDHDNGRCCLGDLGDVAGLQWVEKENVSAGSLGFGFAEYPSGNTDSNCGTLTGMALDLTGLSEGAMMCFTMYNDDHHLTFPQIADIVDYGYAPRTPDREDYDPVTGECVYPMANYGPGDNYVDERGIRWYTI